MALNFVPASALQMLNGGTIVTTFICSIIFLKMKVKRHHTLGCIITFIGVLIVGAINTVYSSEEDVEEGIVIFH